MYADNFEDTSLCHFLHFAYIKLVAWTEIWIIHSIHATMATSVLECQKKGFEFATVLLILHSAGS